MLVLSCSVVLLSCATPKDPGMLPPVPAEALGHRGLLVAHIYVPDWPIWHNADVHIDTRSHGGNQYNGNIVMAMPAGVHRFKQLVANNRFVSPGVVSNASLGVDREFTIESGKITNLGLIVYLPAESSDSLRRSAPEQRRQYRTVVIDNSAEIRRYLEINFGTSLASANDRSIHLAEGAYLASHRLPGLRQTIAAQEQRQSTKLISNSTLSVVYGNVGTIAIHKPRTGSRPAEFEVLDTGTVADIVDACRDGEKLIFIASDGKLLTLENGKLTSTSFPQPVDPARVTSRNGSVVVVGDRMHILTSKDGGRSWDAYHGAARENRMRGVDLASDSEGVYVYSGYPGPPKSISFVPHGSATPRPIEGPQYSWNFMKDGLPNLIARDAGLFVIPWKGLNFYFRPRATGRWEERSTPDFSCTTISVDSTGEKLKTVCGGETYESRDSGLKWSTGPSGT
jgi:hypothetical protein